MKVKDEPLLQKRGMVTEPCHANGSIWSTLFSGGSPASTEAAKRFFDELGIPIAILDRDLNLIYGNRAFQEVFGFFPDISNTKHRFPTLFRRLNQDGFDSWWAEIQWFNYRQFDGIFEFVAGNAMPRVYKVIFSRHENGGFYSATFINITSEERQRHHLRKRLAHSRSLMNRLSRLTHVKDEKRLFEEFVAFANDFWRTTAAIWMHFDPVTQRFSQAYTWPDGDPGLPQKEIPGNAEMLEWLARETPYRLTTVNELKAHGMPETWTAGRAEKAVVLPLFNDDRLQACLILAGDHQLDSVAPEDMRLAAESLQTAFQTALLLAEVCRYRRLFQSAAAKRDLSDASFRDVRPVAGRLAQQLHEIVGCRLASVVLAHHGAVEWAEHHGDGIAVSDALPEWLLEAWQSKPSVTESGVLELRLPVPQGSNEMKRFFGKHRLGSVLISGTILEDGRQMLAAGLFDDRCMLEDSTKASFLLLANQGMHLLHAGLIIQALKHSRDFMDGILKQSAYAIICTDRAGRIKYYNRGARQMLGYSEEEVIGKEVSQFWLENPAQIRQMLAGIGENDHILDYETYLKHKNGEYIPFSLSLAALYDDRGRISGYLGIGRDISEKKQAEEELQQRREELEDLIYLITHNLKSPIVSVEGFANLLIEEAGPRLDEESFKYLDRIKKNVESMNTMISDLLEFSRFGKMDFSREQVDVQELVNELVEELQVQFAPVTIRVEIPRPLPTVVANAEGIKTVFENLLNNAAKYRKPRQDVHIKIWYEEKPRFFAFHVEDNGIGIEPEAQKKIFNLFQRAANAADIHGTGVGLAICKRIITRQGGFISVHSAPGQGTRFSFTLPKCETDEPVSAHEA